MLVEPGRHERLLARLTPAAQRRLEAGPTEELQFGHGVAAVDDGRRPAAPRGTSGNFNSATALPPWMTNTPDGKASDIELLQFGHGVAAVDDREIAPYDSR